jgi:hypothetical protein
MPSSSAEVASSRNATRGRTSSAREAQPLLLAGGQAAVWSVSLVEPVDEVRQLHLPQHRGGPASCRCRAAGPG